MANSCFGYWLRRNKKIIETYDLFKAIAEDTEFSPNFNDGYRIELIADAILESAEKKVNGLAYSSRSLH
ncbi:hypothetical protein GCM10020331_009150 [Ectobacillus funiculus]